MTDTLMAFEEVNWIWVMEKTDTVVYNASFVSLRPDAAKGLELALDVLAKAIGRDIDHIATLRAQIESERKEYRDAANAGTLRFQAELADLRRRLAEWEERAIEFARIIDGRNEK